jgi:hypothetical protein
MVTIAYADTAEREPPIPMIPPKSPERASRDCSEEPTTCPRSCSSSMYAESANPPVMEVAQSVEEHTCSPPPATIQPMSASIYEVGRDEILPTEEVYDDATGLPMYIAPYIIRSESDEDDNARVANWTPIPMPPIFRRAPSRELNAARSAPRGKKASDLESVTGSMPKKKRNFWMFRRGKKDGTSSTTSRPTSMLFVDHDKTGPKTYNPLAKLARSSSVRKGNGSVRESCETSAANVAVDSVGKTDGMECASAGVGGAKYTGVTVCEVKVACVEPTASTEEKEVEEVEEVEDEGSSHRIVLAIPEGTLLSDELTARFCC